MTSRRSKPTPPCPELVRQPRGPYGWLDARLLTEHHIRDIGPEATQVLVFLAITADRRGTSWWSRAKMATSLAMALGQLDRALDRLLDQQLVAHKPWKLNDRDGVWQLLPIPEPRSPPPCAHPSGLRSLADILASAPHFTQPPPRSPPDSRAS